MITAPALSLRWRIAALLAVVALAAFLRVPAWRNLGYDIDEQVYLPLAERYAAALERGDTATLRDPLDNFEHPALAKLLFAAALALPPGPAPQDAPRLGQTPAGASAGQPPGLLAARMVSLIASLLLAALLAWRHPLAGLAFALSSWQIKYGVLVYLEAVPALLAAAALLLAERWWLDPAASRRPLIGAALLLGATAAAKHPYALIAGPTIALAVAWQWRRPWGGPLRGPGGALLVAGVALAAMVAFNPFMWDGPLESIRETIAFHLRYSQNDLVQSQGFAPWHNLRLLLKPMPYDPFFPFSLLNQLKLDGLIAVSGLLGLAALWRRSPPLALWLLLSALFLLAWPTKWPHYTELIFAPLSLSAGIGWAAAGGWLWERGKMWYSTGRDSHH